jgi:subtilisin family serine protease
MRYIEIVLSTIRHQEDIKMKALMIGAIAVFASLLLLAEPSVALYDLGAESAPTDLDATRLIVKLKSDLSPRLMNTGSGIVKIGITEFDGLNLKYAVKEQSLLFSRRPASQLDTRLKNIFVLSVDDGSDILQMKRDYESLESVIYAEPDYRVELYDTPNDPLYPHQWALNNTGQGYYHVDRDVDSVVIVHGTPDADIDAEEVFQNPPVNTEPVVVGMVDTGVDMVHPDLATRMWTNPGEIPGNAIDDDHNGYVDDVNGWDFAGEGWNQPPDNDPTDTYGHGTHCSGIVTAISDNSTGVTGIADDCRIMPLKFYPMMLSSWAAEAIVYAADNGADVINMSWGLPYAVKVWEDALDYARAKGLVLVAAAGNDGMERVNFPAGYDNNIAVSASNSDDYITSFSTYGSNINVCAPGYSILSLRAAGTDLYNNGTHIIDNDYILASGTSMAAPHVVGVASYLRAVSPGITHDKAQNIIEQTADDYVDPFGLGWDYPGWDIYSGYGRINLQSALQAAPLVRAKITSPTHFQLIDGIVDITGIADGAEFTSYILEYGVGHTPDAWTEITTSATPVTDGVLGSWNTTEITGIYTVRLRVGEFNEDYVTIYVANETVVEISAPSAGDTIISFAQVIGTAICPDFEKLILDYGAGASPSSWEQICELSTAVSNSEIAIWATDDMPDGDYTLRLSVYSSEGLEGSVSTQLYVQSLFMGENGWRIALTGTVTIVANYGDFDDDGVQEIVVGTSSGVKFYNPDGTPKTVGVPSTPSYDFTVPIPVGNLDGDGIDDFVAVSASPAKLYGFPSSAPTFEVGLPVAPLTERYDYTEEYSYPFLFLQDIDGDGMDEIHYSRGSYNTVDYYIFNADGTQWEYAFPIANTWNSYLPADLDGDGVCEIYCTQPSLVFELDHTGDTVNTYSIEGIESWNPRSPMSAVDIDADGKLELIVGGHFGNNPETYSSYLIYAFNEDLTVVPGWPHDTGINGYFILRPPVFGDLNGDGLLEYVSSFWDIYTSFVHAWNLDGSPFIGDSTQNGFFAQAPDMSTLHMTILADLNGDAQSEIVIAQTPAPLSTYDRQSVAAWQSNGLPLPGWPITVDQNLDGYPARANAPLVGDLDKDGHIDFFMTTIYGDLVFTNFPEYEYTPENSPCPYWRYNRGMDNTYMPASIGLCGDADGSGGVDIDDVVYLIAYIFSEGLPPVTAIGGDPDCSGAPDIDDVVYLIAFIFSQGPEPCADCPPDGK